MLDRPKIGIVTPAREASNNGNWHTASRWSGHLSALADVSVLQYWAGQPLDVLIALHARKSAPSISGFRHARPAGKIVLVLTGTDLYQDMPGDADAVKSVELADAIVVLQDRALGRLAPEAARKARAIVQSSDVPLADTRPRAAADATRFLAIGHLRAVKDPATLADALARLPGQRIEVEQVGSPIDEDLAERLKAVARADPRYRLLGGLPHPEVLDRLASADALVHPSRLEGGANVVVEALCAGIPVLASAIDGNIGLLGDDYPGYFPVGDADHLASLMRRFANDAAYRSDLARHCRSLRSRFSPEVEASEVRSLVSGLL